MPTSLQLSPVTILAAAGVLGVAIGVGSVAWTPQGREKVGTVAKTASVAVGLQRAREPRERDFWSGCNDARSAGTDRSIEVSQVIAKRWTATAMG